jgi:hypothetical protein
VLRVVRFPIPETGPRIESERLKSPLPSAAAAAKKSKEPADWKSLPLYLAPLKPQASRSGAGSPVTAAFPVHASDYPLQPLDSTLSVAGYRGLSVLSGQSWGRVCIVRMQRWGQVRMSLLVRRWRWGLWKVRKWVVGTEVVRSIADVKDEGGRWCTEA